MGHEQQHTTVTQAVTKCKAWSSRVLLAGTTVSMLSKVFLVDDVCCSSLFSETDHEHEGCALQSQAAHVWRELCPPTRTGPIAVRKHTAAVHTVGHFKKAPQASESTCHANVANARVHVSGPLLKAVFGIMW